MNGRLDKHGQTLGMDDRGRCPTGRAGSVRGFAESAGRVRVVVEYDDAEFGEVVLLPCLLARVGARNDRDQSRGEVRVDIDPHQLPSGHPPFGNLFARQSDGGNRRLRIRDSDADMNVRIDK